MTVARSVAEVLDQHVDFEVECIDRMYLGRVSAAAAAPARGGRLPAIPPGVPVRLDRAGGPDQQGLRRGHPPVRRPARGGVGGLRPRPAQGRPGPAVPGRVHPRGGGAVHRSGAGEERCVSHREAPQPTHRRVLPVDRALHRGDQPVLFLLRGRGLRAVLPEVQLLLPLHRQAVHQRQRVGQTPGHPGRDRSHRAGGRLRLLRRPGRAASHLRPAGRGEDRRAATQVAGDPAAPVHREGSGRGLPL